MAWPRLRDPRDVEDRVVVRIGCQLWSGIAAFVVAVVLAGAAKADRAIICEDDWLTGPFVVGTPDPNDLTKFRQYVRSVDQGGDWRVNLEVDKVMEAAVE